jgi:hypothetical protein
LAKVIGVISELSVDMRVGEIEFHFFQVGVEIHNKVVLSFQDVIFDGVEFGVR